MGKGSHRLLPLRREVRVRATATAAFDAFTAQIGAWWPRVMSAHGGKLSFVDGQLEEHGDDDHHVWGEVITWDRPRSLRMTWRHPSHGEDQRTDVTISFVTDGPTTIVRLVQTGWDRIPDPVAAARLYGGDRGWREVLDCFATRAGGLASGRSDG